RSLLTGAGEVELIGSAVHFGFQFSGAGCAVYVHLPDLGGHNYLQYELDGVYQGRVRIEGGDRRPLVIKTGSAGVHTVWVYKATEAMSGAIFVEKIVGQGLVALQRPEAPLIEFIGNSITCGALADGSGPACDAGEYSDHHNAYYAYGPRVARALKANYMLSSVSGIGIYRTWNREGPSMPQVYEKADFDERGSRLWSFGSYRPRVVSIALGTNDLSHGDGKTPRAPFDSARFVGAYVQFVKLVKTKYPSARIALLSSPMVRGSERELLQRCLTAVKGAVDAQYPGGRVETFFFEPMVPRGCGGHPSVEDHAILAAQLEPFFRRLIGG
ncbi:MAG TPA: GDSL-type esterase/lipase family protein, partial [Puia sp.]|nr:GDSL-type esterase/lipase family protein [Puia sp.]